MISRPIHFVHDVLLIAWTWWLSRAWYRPRSPLPDPHRSAE